ncbi:DUF294 nucleotidyltransferase-like domain-containing protein [Nitratidesulfovibrio sp. 1201_IL3209]|uniref:DUF294 nucleotidyltransferase-like domain-containing protein n=1 Tax=Nitratidesulfovibrio sp. 1201_IL3209 TaxID=3084053 RepID=UPI002FDB2098
MHEDVIRFLRGVPPFLFLPRARLRALAFGAQVVFLPAGEELENATEDGMPVLHVVVKGAIAVRGHGPEGGEPLGPGTVFGWPHGQAATPLAYAATDALCYLLPVRAVSDALDDRPGLRELLAPGFGPALLELGASSLARRCALSWQGGRPWQAVTAGEAMPAGFAAAPVQVSLREAARLMTGRQRSAIVLLDGDGRAAGILTDRDFRSRVVAGGAGHGQPAGALMSSPVLCVQAGASCLDVMLLMAGRNIHHVVVVDGDEPVGVLSSHDLMVLRGVSPTALAERIGAAGTLTGLVEAAPRADALAAVLLGEGARPETLDATLPDLHDLMTARLFELGIVALGEPPRPWCFLVFGPAARREAWFRHRQWNGLVVGDGPGTPGNGDGGEDGRVAAYFGTLARFVRDGLRALGFAPCPQGRMAATPGWTLSVSGWRDRFRQLAVPERGSTERHGAPAMPLPVRRGMFDVRPACGDRELGLRVAAVADAALRDVVRAGARWPWEADGAGRGTMPGGEMADTARALAAGQGVQPPGTLARLRALSACVGGAGEILADARRACEYLLLRAARTELARRGAGDGGGDEAEAPDAVTDVVPDEVTDGAAAMAADSPGGPDAALGMDGLDALALRRAREALRALDGLPGPREDAPAPRRGDAGAAVPPGDAPSFAARRGDTP